MNTLIQRPRTPKIINICIQNEPTFSKFKHEIEMSNIYEQLNKNQFANPQLITTFYMLVSYAFNGRALISTFSGTQVRIAEHERLQSLFNKMSMDRS